MRDNYKSDELGLCIDYWKMNWIILIDNSGSMGPHALDPNSQVINVKNAISAMLEEIETISVEQEILSYIQIITFNDVISYAVGNRSRGENITEAINSWQNYELIPYGGTNTADAILEAVEAVRTHRTYLGGHCLSSALILITDGMVDLADRVGNSVNHLKSVRKGQTIRASIGLRHEYSSELDPFASRGTIEYLDGRIESDRLFSFFAESCDDLSSICKNLSRGFISIALADEYNENSNRTLFNPTDDWDEEDDDWWWE